jgi:hypothetical protein
MFLLQKCGAGILPTPKIKLPERLKYPLHVSNNPRLEEISQREQNGSPRHIGLAQIQKQIQVRVVASDFRIGRVRCLAKCCSDIGGINLRNGGCGNGGSVLVRNGAGDGTVNDLRLGWIIQHTAAKQCQSEEKKLLHFFSCN